MEKKAEFIESISHDIFSLFTEFDLTQLTLNDFKHNFRESIAHLAKKYDFLPETQIQVKHDGERIHYIDVVWFVGPVPYVSFVVSTSFRPRRVLTLLSYESYYRFFVFCGSLSTENTHILKALDKTGDITLIEITEYKKSLLKKPERKHHSFKDYKAQNFLENRNQDAIDTTNVQIPNQTQFSPTVSDTYELFLQGLSLREIAGKRNLAESTISYHLIRVMNSGKYLNLDSLIPETTQKAIIQTAKKLDTTKLKPIKEVLGDQASWEEIRLVLVNNEQCDLFEQD